LSGTRCTRTVAYSNKHGPRKVTSAFSSPNCRTKLWSKLAPLRAICLSIISLIETSSKPVTTPKSKPKKDDDESLPPTSIATISMVLTSSPLSPSPFDQTVLLTHSDKSIHPLSVSSTIHTIVYPTEKEMLLGFRDFLIKYDPDLLTGYDLCEEISEILDRAKDLDLPKSFPYLARPSSTALKPRSRQTYNASWVRAQRRMAGTSNREYIELGCTGRLVLDMRQVMEKEERLRTYSLNESSEHVMGKKLEFLSATTIAKLLASEELDDKRRVADYAVKRAWAGLAIMRKNASLVSAVEMARVFGLNFQEVFMGQMRRMWGYVHPPRVN
jgi:DNA polymerase delta subunit 1